MSDPGKVSAEEWMKYLGLALYKVRQTCPDGVTITSADVVGLMESGLSVVMVHHGDAGIHLCLTTHAVATAMAAVDPEAVR
jgi:hypothetical protein